MSEPLQYGCDEHSYQGFSPCPKCKPPLAPADGSAVYVDAAEWPYGRMMMCHMLADTPDALHAMADRIGVSRRWFQYARYPHYDICKSKRALAVKFGAVEIDRRQFVEIAKSLMGPNV